MAAKSSAHSPAQVAGPAGSLGAWPRQNKGLLMPLPLDGNQHCYIPVSTSAIRLANPGEILLHELSLPWRPKPPKLAPTSTS